jgi:hypothetical protein
MKNLLRVTIAKTNGVYQIELRDDHGGPWTETFGSKEQLEAFIIGLRTGALLGDFGLEGWHKVEVDGASVMVKMEIQVPYGESQLAHLR